MYFWFSLLTSGHGPQWKDTKTSIAQGVHWNLFLILQLHSCVVLHQGQKCTSLLGCLMALKCCRNCSSVLAWGHVPANSVEFSSTSFTWAFIFRKCCFSVETSCLVSVSKKGFPAALADYRDWPRTLWRSWKDWFWHTLCSSQDPLQYVYQPHIGKNHAIIHLLHRALHLTGHPRTFVRIHVLWLLQQCQAAEKQTGKCAGGYSPCLLVK